MTFRQLLWFTLAYLALVATAVWFNLAVLCQGDAKYDQGCGGFGVYIPLWEIFLAPLAVSAVLLELWRRSAPPPTGRLALYLAGILVVEEIGWLVIDTFPALLLTEAIVIGIAIGYRVRMTRNRSGTGAPAA